MNEKLKKALELLKLSKEEVVTEVNTDVVTLAEAKLESGVVIVAEEFKEGMPVFIKAEDSEESNVPLEVGEYIMENGDVLKVEVEGEILSISAPEQNEAPAETPSDEELAEENGEEGNEAPEVDPKDEIIANLIMRVEALEEMALESNEAPNENAEELSDETPEATEEEVIELSHTPESKEKKGFKIPNRGFGTARDRVYARLNK